MIESKWIPLRSSDIAEEVRPSDAQWSKEYPSLYDIPTHARSYYDASSGIFTIEFRYISDEPTQKSVIKPYITVFLGKSSRRVYVVQLDIHGFNRDKHRIAAEASESIRNFVGITSPNRDIAGRVIVNKESVLLSAVA